MPYYSMLMLVCHITQCWYWYVILLNVDVDDGVTAGEALVKNKSDELEQLPEYPLDPEGRVPKKIMSLDSNIHDNWESQSNGSSCMMVVHYWLQR